ncbi:hypothetical protein BJH93_08185 [Kocuria polaris]|nr:hypothetical protein [Kocuria polaris]
MLALEAQPEPSYGYGPTREALLAGRRDFSGLVLRGVWSGHDAVVTVWERARRRFDVEEASFTVDFWLVHRESSGVGDDLNYTADSIPELLEMLSALDIQWYPPATSLAKVGRMYGGDGTIEGMPWMTSSKRR